MRKLFVIIVMAIGSLAQAQTLTSKAYKEDFTFLWKTINENYAYFDKKQTDWNEVKTHYEKGLDTIKSNWDFTNFLEIVFREIYDDHASLHTNTPYSRRLVPSGTDIWATFNKGKALITEVRKNFGAEKVGIHAGMEVIAVNDVPVEQAIAPFLPNTLKKDDPEARNYALRLLLAGNHVHSRKLSLKYRGQILDYYPDQPQMLLENIHYPSLVTASVSNGVGYIRVNNCLFDNNLIPAFDSVMLTMAPTKALILDLRETPSGGNTTVARAILGWFINKEQFYQKHEWTVEEKRYGVKRSWIEIASPHKGKYYDKPLIVLTSHWTGSVGEGITIAFDGFKRATIIGTEMARLLGAVYSYQLPHSKIGFSFPAEKLYHINGMPREEYQPTVLIDPTKFTSAKVADPILEKALEILKKQEQKK